jgi:uncharacterized delta-60 repeat protein
MANSGDLDTSFSGDGKRAISFGGTDEARVVLVHPNGRIVVGGGAAAPSFCVARLRTNGALDTTFGSDGKRMIDFGGDQESAFGAVLQPDGKIVVAGYTQDDEDVAVARLNANGSPDTTFGAAGKATVDFGVATFGNAVALQPNGRIVVAGQRTGRDDFAVARLLGRSCAPATPTEVGASASRSPEHRAVSLNSGG